ncbi:NAD(P)-dependent oxidoreductase [Oceaniglobus ichthyenteri]|uniref:NAD(P)-dependent oxidoreductase n=1 Tax=Oceaniglobus ichthyenteri TaxID=2136177 RepID=UPI000D39E064|nr:NAD(P)-dependent oxidoreductase [Oceaniglobus ichthyenteri]
MSTLKIALLGTGLMGAPMSRNLLKAGYALSVWNRSRAKADPLAEAGATVCDTAVQAVTGADVVITMLSNGGVVGDLVNDAALTSAMAKGAIWLDMSSIKPEEARTHAAHLSDLGIGHLDAPVSGGTKGAQEASLAIMVGGDSATFEKAAPVFGAMGRAVHVGPSGSGQLSKLANQAIVAVTIAAVAEAMLLVRQGGADPAAVRAALKGGFADSVILQQHGERMTTGNFAPGGLSKMQLKDLNNLLEEADHLNLTLPASQQARDRFDTYCAEMGGADLDHSGLFQELLARNKLSD